MEERQGKYFESLLGVFKMVAFHQIYMQAAREELCRDECYDPRTAFKSIDAFKHNRVIAYELYSFFDLHRIQSTVQECQQVIRSVNRQLGDMDYENFCEMTLPVNTTRRNLSLTRFNTVQIGVGSYSRLMFVKEHSEHVIALFLQKQLNFFRQFLFKRQEFCRQWGADVYTLLQKLFRPKRDFLIFQQFYQMGRQHRVLFNQDEFKAIWRRSKKGSMTLQQQARKISLTFQHLQSLLLVSDFSTKRKYGIQQNVPIQKTVQKPVCSYRVSHWKRQEEWKKSQKYRQLQKMQQMKETGNYNMKYKFAYLQSLTDPCSVRHDLHKKSQEWEDKVERMNQSELILAYNKLVKPLVIFRQ